MSLLMEALKKAEQAKRDNHAPAQQGAEQADSPSLAATNDTADTAEPNDQTNALEQPLEPQDAPGTTQTAPLPDNTAADDASSTPADSTATSPLSLEPEPATDDLALHLPDDLVAAPADSATTRTPELSLDTPDAEQDLDLDLADDVDPSGPEPSPVTPAADEQPPQVAATAPVAEAPPVPAPRQPNAQRRPAPPIAQPLPRPRQAPQSKPYLLWGSVTLLVLLLAIGGYSYVQWQIGATGGITSLPPRLPPQPIVDTPAEPAAQILPPAEDVAPAVEETAEVRTAAPAQPQSAPVSPPRATTAPSTEQPPARPAPAPAKQVTAPQPPAQPDTTKSSPPAKQAPLHIERQQQQDPLYAALNRAYTAYQAGELENAQNHYTDALALRPDNRDALLGLAVIAQRHGDTARAQSHYNRLLALDPKDSMAISGLMSLRSNSATLENESRIKLLLDEEPNAAHLHFALGTQYVAQNRWGEAQQAFFEAYRRAPDNADYAFNLAVSLDRLGQANAALPYYRQALQQAGEQSVSFDPAAVSRRLARLTGNGAQP